MIKQIIPTNFSIDIKTFNEKLKKLSFSKQIHIDFMDGNFTKLSSIKIYDMNKIKDYKNIDFEIHLMAKNPILYLEQILELNIKKVLIHIEVFKNKIELENTIKKFKENNLKVFLALNPKTKIIEIDEDLIDGFLLMSVNPGKEGQKFIDEIYEKIVKIKKLYSKKIKIQIDGGINDKNTQKLIKNGANILSVGSFISSSLNPEENFIKLNDLIKN